MHPVVGRSLGSTFCDLMFKYKRKIVLLFGLQAILTTVSLHLKTVAPWFCNCIDIF